MASLVSQIDPSALFKIKVTELVWQNWTGA
jgi:hypothetical protein